MNTTNSKKLLYYLLIITVIMSILCYFVNLERFAKIAKQSQSNKRGMKGSMKGGMKGGMKGAMKRGMKGGKSVVLTDTQIQKNIINDALNAISNLNKIRSRGDIIIKNLNEAKENKSQSDINKELANAQTTYTELKQAMEQISKSRRELFQLYQKARDQIIGAEKFLKYLDKIQYDYGTYDDETSNNGE